MICEKCGSGNVIRKGTTKTAKGAGRTIWKCRDCDRYTTAPKLGKQGRRIPQKPPSKEQVARWREANPDKRKAQLERQKARKREKYQQRKLAS